jgi:hypothetical protein
MTFHLVCGYSFRNQGIPYYHPYPPMEEVGKTFNNLSFRSSLTWRSPR